VKPDTADTAICHEFNTRWS